MANFFFIYRYISLPSQATFISNRVKKTGGSQPEMKCSQKPCHVQKAELCCCHTMSQSSSSIQTGYPVLTQ